MQTGSSEEDALEKFLASRSDVTRDMIADVFPQDGAYGRQFGFYEIHYLNGRVIGSPDFQFTQTHDNCVECGTPLEKPQRGPHPTYCSNRCTQRACRRRKRERDANL